MATTIGKRICVVQLDCEIIGTFSNLKKACEEMKEKDDEFYSYSVMSKRRKDENPIEFETEKGAYKVYIETVE